jgi:hypothetical protein
MFHHALHIAVMPSNSSRPPSPLQETEDLVMHGIIPASKI